MTFEQALRFLQSTAGVNFLIGAVWSYLLEIIPGLKDWFDGLSATMKRIVVAAFVLAVPLTAFGLKLALDYESFSIDNAWMVLVAWASAFFGSQVAHTIGPFHPNSLRSASNK